MILRHGPISIHEFDRLIEDRYFAGVEQRVDLIRGEIRYMSPAGPIHEEVLSRLETWSEKWAPTRGFRKRSEKSLNLPLISSVPEPDLVWVKNRDYMQARPSAGDAVLVVEVSLSSLEEDRSEMALLYAEADIPEYWIVNCIDECVEVFRQPENKAYRERFVVHRTEKVSPLAATEAWLEVSALFEREE